MAVLKWGVALLMLFAVSTCQAGQIWIDDASGEIGKVDTTTGAVTLVGSSGVPTLTDIAFDPSGNLWGLSYNRFFSINTSTGAATFVGNLGGTTFNGLVFDKNGTAFASTSSGGLYTINTVTGTPTLVGSIGADSSGDLAFQSGVLYMSASDGHLYSVDTVTGVGTDIGDIGKGNTVYGLADIGGTLYGAAGTSIFAIDTSTGAGAAGINYSGNGLGQALGATAEPVPAPSSLVMLSTVLVMFGSVYAIRRRKLAA